MLDFGVQRSVSHLAALKEGIQNTRVSQIERGCPARAYENPERMLRGRDIDRM